MFNGKIALVTGSGRGIGRAIALHFADCGADVVVNFFRNRASAEQTAAEIRQRGRRAVLIKANVGELNDLQRMFDEIEKELGGLDILVSNAAPGYNRPVMEQNPKADWTMNIRAPCSLRRRGLHDPWKMRRRGRHLSPGSTAAGLLGSRGNKAALSVGALSGCKLAPKNIVVNTVSLRGAQADALKHLTRSGKTTTLSTRLPHKSRPGVW
jgi:enoyl-[acyl-carrier protein] reductase III